MPFPFVLIGAALAAGVLVRTAKELLRDESARQGYCTWCGEHCWHSFHADGLSWAKVGPIAIATGGLGTAVAGLLSRNVYRCGECSGLTLPCRIPGCSGMARSTQYYDEEWCGACCDSNNIHAERRRKERVEADKNKLVELLRMHEERLRALELEESRLRADRNADKARIQGLVEVMVCQRQDINAYRRELGMAPMAWS